MGWEPSLRFKLREDEVTLGPLIIDKAYSEKLAGILLQIKNGERVDLSMFASNLNQYCYTDDEFEKAKEDYRNVKEDIKYFKSLCRSHLMINPDNWFKRMGTTANYIVGSETWTVHYKELKMCAAELYKKLKDFAFDFKELTTVFEQRYGDVVKLSTPEERIGGLLQAQYAQDYAAGDPDALKKYTAAMIECGLWDEEKAKANSLLLGAAEATQMFVNKNPQAPSYLENSNEVKEEVKETVVEPTKVMEYTTEVLEEMNRVLESTGCEDEESYHIMLTTLIESLKNNGLVVQADWSIAQQNGNIESMKESVHQIMNFINFRVNKMLIDSNPVEGCEDAYNKIMGIAGSGSVEQSSDDYILAGPETYKKWVDDVRSKYEHTPRNPYILIGSTMVEHLHANEIIIKDLWRKVICDWSDDNTYTFVDPSDVESAIEGLLGCCFYPQNARLLRNNPIRVSSDKIKKYLGE